MSVKYFPIYFQDSLDWTPIRVQYAYVACRICTAVNIMLLEALAKPLGRVICIQVSFLISIGALFSMGFFRNVYIVFPLFILRT